VIALNFEKKLILIANTEYAGENKKSVFTLLNYLLPGKGVMAMHCSANHADDDPDDAAVFFGLSGTGKTTLGRPHPHPDRRRRAWLVRSRHLQFRGRLLRQDHQPPRRSRAGDLRHHRNFGTVIENMVYDPETLELDFDDDSLTANTRCAYPLEQIPNASPPGWRVIPRTSSC
jgi:phosphoenolpyruvate carboxykinase (ATP)